MILDHCHRASCVQIIDQLRTTITEKDARIAQLEEALKVAENTLQDLAKGTRQRTRHDEAINKINEVIGS